MVFKGWIQSEERERERRGGNEVTKERRAAKMERGGAGGECRKGGEKESGSLAEAFMPKFARRTFRGSFVIFHEKAL